MKGNTTTILVYTIVLIIVLGTFMAGLNNETYTTDDWDIFAQQDYTGDGIHQNIDWNVTNINVTAEKFILSEETTIRRIGVWINKCNANLYDVTVQIKEDLAKPSVYNLEYTIPNSELQAGGGIWNYEDVNITLPAGTYYLAVGSDPSGKNPHCWIYYDIGNYSNGDLWFEEAQVNGGKADGIFRLYKITSTTSQWNDTWLELLLGTMLGLIVLVSIMLKMGLV